MSAPRIRLHIDRLVLRGVSASQRIELLESMRQELQTLLGTPGAASELGGSRHAAVLRGRRPAAVRSVDGPGLGQLVAGGLVAELKR